MRRIAGEYGSKSAIEWPTADQNAKKSIDIFFNSCCIHVEVNSIRQEMCSAEWNMQMRRGIPCHRSDNNRWNQRRGSCGWSDRLRADAGGWRCRSRDRCCCRGAGRPRMDPDSWIWAPDPTGATWRMDSAEIRRPDCTHPCKKLLDV